MLLLLRWSQTRQRTSLLPDGAVPGPDPVSGTQSTGNMSESACCMAFWNLERGPWMQNGQCSVSVLRTRRGWWEDPSPLTVEKEQHLKLFWEGLKCSGHGPQGKWWGVRTWRTQNAIASRHTARISKKKGYPGSSVTKRNTIGGFLFQVPLTWIWESIICIKNYFY